MELNFDRQIGIFDPKEHQETIGIIGSGSVGSFTALALSKMGANVCAVYDSDKIEPHNIPNQFFKLNQVGKKKCVALNELLKEFTGNIIKPYEAVDDRVFPSFDITISAVDSMKARKLIWSRVKKCVPKLYIDSRMGGKIFSVYSVNPLDKKSVKNYEESLVDDSETLQIPCTERTIIFNVLGVASLVCSQVSKYLNNEKIASEVHFNYNDYTSVTIV